MTRAKQQKIAVYLRLRFIRSHAGIAQLVERNLAKVEVASSSLVSRSNFKEPLKHMLQGLFCVFQNNVDAP